MRIIGLMPVRNEEHEIGLTLRAAVMWCDYVIVLLHACTDGTRDIVEQVHRETGRVLMLFDSTEEWREMPMRQRMLECARENRATHIALIDADEILTGNMLSFDGSVNINEIGICNLVQSTPHGSILQLPGYNMRNGIHQYHANGIWGNLWFSVAFPDVPSLGWSGDRFHAREPGPLRLTPFRPIAQGQGGVMHLWGADERRLVAKHRLYRVIERIRWPNKSVKEIERMYSWATNGTGPGDTPAEWKYLDTPESWWHPYEHLMGHLHIDAEPWQEAALLKLVAEHGREKFAGLNLFGVA